MGIGINNNGRPAGSRNTADISNIVTGASTGPAAGGRAGSRSANESGAGRFDIPGGANAPGSDTRRFGHGVRAPNVPVPSGRSTSHVQLGAIFENPYRGTGNAQHMATSPPSVAPAHTAYVPPERDIERGCCRPSTCCEPAECCSCAPWKPILGTIVGGVLGAGAYVLWRRYHHTVLGTEPEINPYTGLPGF